MNRFRSAIVILMVCAAVVGTACGPTQLADSHARSLDGLWLFVGWYPTPETWMPAVFGIGIEDNQPQKLFLSAADTCPLDGELHNTDCGELSPFQGQAELVLEGNDVSLDFNLTLMFGDELGQVQFKGSFVSDEDITGRSIGGGDSQQECPAFFAMFKASDNPNDILDTAAFFLQISEERLEAVMGDWEFCDDTYSLSME